LTLRVEIDLGGWGRRWLATLELGVWGTDHGHQVVNRNSCGVAAVSKNGGYLALQPTSVAETPLG
jgi:hypothetical protein